MIAAFLMGSFFGGSSVVVVVDADPEAGGFTGGFFPVTTPVVGGLGGFFGFFPVGSKSARATPIPTRDASARTTRDRNRMGFASIGHAGDRSLSPALPAPHSRI